jgi:hypothetical protein
MPCAQLKIKTRGEAIAIVHIQAGFMVKGQAEDIVAPLP